MVAADFPPTFVLSFNDVAPAFGVPDLDNFGIPNPFAILTDRPYRTHDLPKSSFFIVSESYDC